MCVITAGALELPGSNPVVIIGPNGSGKTKRSRELQSDCVIQYLNALRNTRIPVALQAMALTDAQNNFRSQRNQSRQNYWELASEFDFLLMKLFAEHADVAIRFMEAAHSGSAEPDSTSVWRGISEVWGEMFPGRRLTFRDYRPLVLSTVETDEVEYSAHHMSDGEKAALYLAAHVLSADQHIVFVVDEPETHLHSLLAARIWDVLEAARPDIRFVYITHDLHFAMSRRQATYLLASPTHGLHLLDVDTSLPGDVAEVLLGTASFSFYAKRVVLCEGTADSLDAKVYGAWFASNDTIVKPVGSCVQVQRCISALDEKLVAGLETIGLIDRDFHSDEYLMKVGAQLHVMPLHEVESLLCLPAVVEAVCRHISRAFDASAYLVALRGAIAPTLIQKVVLERWKRALEPRLDSLVSQVNAKGGSLDALAETIPAMFDSADWAFSPIEIFTSERERVENAVASGEVHPLLEVLHGKPLLAAAATYCGLDKDAYIAVLVASLTEDDSPLGVAVDAAWRDYLPSRRK